VQECPWRNRIWGGGRRNGREAEVTGFAWETADGAATADLGGGRVGSTTAARTKRCGPGWARAVGRMRTTPSPRRRRLPARPATMWTSTPGGARRQGLRSGGSGRFGGAGGG